MESKKNKIFVSICSYRDTKCTATVESCFKMAKYPENVFIGLCQQNAPGDVECVSDDNEFLKKYSNNIRIINVNHYEAKGPTWARYLCSTLYRGEEFFLQIDSHSLFAKDWDVHSISQIKTLKSRGVKKPVLSHYPRSYDDHSKDQSDNNVTRICQAFFNTRGMISFKGAEFKSITNGELVETPFVAAGMIFCEGYFMKELPFDPHLPYLFVGEEIFLSARFWTHGWDIYSPNRNIVYHYYTRPDDNKIWTDNPTYSDIPAFNKVKMLMNLKNSKEVVPDYVTFNIIKYGLGTTRSLNEYYKFAGIDINKKKVTKNFCK